MLVVVVPHLTVVGSLSVDFVVVCVLVCLDSAVVVVCVYHLFVQQ